MGDLPSLSSAVEDFRAARSKAMLQDMLSALRGEQNRLLSFEEVRQKLKAQEMAERGLRDIPLDAIVGSVGRYNDFTRDFLPRSTVNEERWARIKLAATELAGLPPIEVYQIGEVYFVKDGNHRVSVARQLGAKYIHAYVTEIRTRVSITPQTDLDELIIKSEYVDFLEKTRIDTLRPEADLTVTAPGKYQDLIEHIDVHRYYLGIERQRDIPYPEAVTSWYDTVYLPIVQLIREWGILRYFPKRTETDLYLWIGEHQSTLGEQLGWNIRPEAAAADLVEHYSSQSKSVFSRLGGRLLETISVNEPGPPPGYWRYTHAGEAPPERLFLDIMVAISGAPEGWNALEQALVIARREGSHLHGIHIVKDKAALEHEAVLAVKAEFEQRCAQAGIPGELRLEAGDISREICGRARWSDLLIANLAYPPGTQPLARLSSGFRTLLQRCPLPLLATPRRSTDLTRALLAYDGSPKAEEALFIATYLAGKWGLPLVVVTVAAGDVGQATLNQAQKYLEDHHVQATYVLEKGQVAEAVLGTTRDHSCDLIIMGGYGLNPVLEVVLGSSVDQVLRESEKPMLICR